MKRQYALPYFENDVLYMCSAESIFVIHIGIAPGLLSSIRNIPSFSICLPQDSDLSESSLSLHRMLLSKVTLKSLPPSIMDAPFLILNASRS